MVQEQVRSHKDAFYVVDLQEVARKYAEWQAELPRVRPYYAVKCNDDPKIVATLAKLGAGFDCATKGEISMCLSQGVPAEDIIFAHPAKQPSHLHYAAKTGVRMTTFDNEDEVRKIAVEHPGSDVVLRILTDDSHSVCRLGLKFGAPLEQVQHLVSVAKSVGLNPVGISYHVGSGNGHADSFAQAVRDARKAFDMAAEVGVNMTLLDIGGGFPGSELGAASGTSSLHPSPDETNPYSKHPSFKVIAGAVREALDLCFPEGCGVRLMAEPGRYFVKSTHVLAVNVVGKRVTADEASPSPRINYYVNDGLYGSFNCILYDHVTCAPSLLLSTRPELASQEDDSIVKLGMDGSAVVSDMMGLGHAVELSGTQQLEQAQARVMTIGGEAEEGMSMSGHSSGSQTVRVSLALGGSAGASSSAHKGASLGGRSSSYAYSSLAAPAPSSLFPTTVWGPTCDSMDKISDSLTMPQLEIGDWLVFENMGAYTIAGSCKFNGFPLASKVYLEMDGSVHIQPEEQ